MRAVRYKTKRTGENWKKNRNVISVSIGSTTKKWDKRTLAMVERKAIDNTKTRLDRRDLTMIERKALDNDMNFQFTRIGKKRQIFTGKEK